MSRIRTVKPELFRHENLFAAEQQEQLPLRLAFIGLFICCDREGRFKWRPGELKLDILPYDQIDFAKVLDALAKHSFIEKYTINDKDYGWIPSWKRHQTINSRERNSQLPPAPTDNQCSIAIENETKTKSNYRQINIELIQQVFAHWKKITGNKQATLDRTRENHIRKAFNYGYNVNQLYQAIEGCHKTPYNMGHNKQGELYNSLKLILRDSDQIDRFINNYHKPPIPATENTTMNQHNLQQWLNLNEQPIEKEVTNATE